MREGGLAVFGWPGVSFRCCTTVLRGRTFSLGVIAMGSGGARSRSGPQPDPSSGRSDRRGLSLSALPADGFDGEAPDFPLPMATPRELEVWDEMWRTPQAAAWAEQPWRWHEIGTFVRLSARVENADSSASLLTPWLRMQTTLGLNPDGLKVNGWQIGDTTPEPEAATTGAKQPKKGGSRARLGVIQGGAAG